MFTKNNFEQRISILEDGASGEQVGRGGGTGENVENYMRENIGWILFKTCNSYIFLEIQFSVL